MQIRMHYAGLLLVTNPGDWTALASLTAPKFAKARLALAGNVDPRYFRSYPRKPKVVSKKGYVSRSAVQQHVAASQVLDTGFVA